MYKKYFDFWDYIYFVNKFFNTIRSMKLKERMKLLFFNNFLLRYIQDRLCSCNLKIIRSTIQYLILMITLISDQEIVNLIYNFIFGFTDSKTNYVFTYNTDEQTSYLAESLNNNKSNNSNLNIDEKNHIKDINNSSRKNSIFFHHSRNNSYNSTSKAFNFNDQDFINLNNYSNSNFVNKNIEKTVEKNNIYYVNTKIIKNNLDNNNTEYLSTKNSENKIIYSNSELENDMENNFYFCQEYNFNAHNNIRIGLKILNNMNVEEEKINLIISVLFEKFFEKCPFLMFNRLVFPFAELCLRQINDPNKFLKIKKTIPDLEMIYNLIKLYDDSKNITNYLDNNIKVSSFNTLNHYIKNDIDFYFYYLNKRQDEENYDYYNEEENNIVVNYNIVEDFEETVFERDFKDLKQDNRKGELSVKGEINKNINEISNYSNNNFFNKIDGESTHNILQNPNNKKNICSINKGEEMQNIKNLSN